MLLPDSTREPTAVGLYAHAGDTEADFDLYENDNFAADPVNRPVVEKLHAIVVAQWAHGGCHAPRKPCIVAGELTCY